MQPILIGSASEKETLRSNFPEDLECLMTATSDEELLLVFFVVVATVEAVDVVVRTLERAWMKGRIVHILTPKEFDPKEIGQEIPKLSSQKFLCVPKLIRFERTFEGCAPVL